MFSIFSRNEKSNEADRLRDEYISPFLDELISKSTVKFEDALENCHYDKNDNNHKVFIFLWLLNNLPAINDINFSFKHEGFLSSSSMSHSQLSQSRIELVREYVDADREIFADTYRYAKLRKALDIMVDMADNGHLEKISRKLKQAPDECFEKGTLYSSRGYADRVIRGVRPVARQIFDAFKNNETPDFKSDFLIWISTRRADQELK
ncbi:hypothetical protein [Rhizobium sp. P007]|uniref:hypothetical protein n=1 Tax=Rhizobium sp. P007 TaxID=285908 RepID=UPI00115A3B3F|nr:hypothetical protein [Rhizobium sp. P007]CAD7041079.1 hypothetical protein RP007_00705 [Rhizobium sp. P007]